MAGVPAVTTLRDDYSEKAQKAALLMSVNSRMSHWPDPDWLCYSEGADEGAGSSTLFLGVHGLEAIDGYIEDRGEANYFVPHRRMLLYPHTQTMGVGDVPPTPGYAGANALWVLGEMSQERPETRDQFVAWPPPGYVPYPLVYPRWSFSRGGADFSRATVLMTHGREEILLKQSPVVDGYGENTLVWEPQVASEAPPQADTWYNVSLHDVLIGQTRYRFSYVVILFDPSA
jgi:hypothetical protein